MSKNLSFVKLCKVSDRICDVSVERDAHIFTDGIIVSLHSLADPVKHDTDKTVFIKICDKVFLLFCKRGIFGLLFNDSHNEIMCQMEEVIFNLLTADGIIGIHNKRFVFVYCFKNLLKTFLPCCIGLLALKSFS